MNERRRRLLMCTAALPALQWPRAGAAQSGRVPTVTRLVKIFMEREGELLEAMRAHDDARLAALLSDRFEMRVGHEPGTPVPRADWIAQVSAGRPVFVVDMWEPDGESWRLRVRYATVLAPTQARVPGDVAPPKIDKRY